jgi:hypothetical protein
MVVTYFLTWWSLGFSDVTKLYLCAISESNQTVSVKGGYSNEQGENGFSVWPLCSFLFGSHWIWPGIELSYSLRTFTYLVTLFRGVTVGKNQGALYLSMTSKSPQLIQFFQLPLNVNYLIIRQGYTYGKD